MQTGQVHPNLMGATGLESAHDVRKGGAIGRQAVPNRLVVGDGVLWRHRSICRHAHQYPGVAADGTTHNTRTRAQRTEGRRSGEGGVSTVKLRGEAYQ